MANILDSFRETFEDKNAFFKLTVFAAPLYYAYDLYLKNPKDMETINLILIITGFFLLGFFIKTTSNVLNEQDRVLPSLNPLKLAWASIKSIIAIGPISWITLVLADMLIKFLTGFTSTIPWLSIGLAIIIWSFAASICLTSFLMFVKRESIIDAYNFKKLSNCAGDLLIGVFFCFVQVFLVNLPTTILIGYSISVLLGVGPIEYGFIAYSIVFNIAIIAHYMAQLQYEVLGISKN